MMMMTTVMIIIAQEISSAQNWIKIVNLTDTARASPTQSQGILGLKKTGAEMRNDFQTVIWSYDPLHQQGKIRNQSQ